MREVLLLGVAAALGFVAPTLERKPPRFSSALLEDAVEYESVHVEDARSFPLRGTWFRAGPGNAKQRGIILGITFGEDGAICRARYVRTSGGDKDLANGGCCYWRDLLYAVYDCAKPYQMDALSCGTQKRSELGGMLRDGDKRFDWLRTMNGKLYSGQRETGFFSTNRVLIDVFDANFKIIDQVELGSDTIDFAPTSTGKIAALTPKGIVIDKQLVVELDIAPSSGNVLVDERTVIIRSPSRSLRDNGKLFVNATPVTEAHSVSDGIAASSGGLLNLETRSAWQGDEEHGIVGVPTVIDSHVMALLHRDDKTQVALWTRDDLSMVAIFDLPHALPALQLSGPFVSALQPSLEEVRSAETLARLYARKSKEWNEIEAGFSGIGIKQFFFPKGVSGG